MVPPLTLNAGLPKKPAKNRHTSREAMLFDTAAPITNSVAMGRLTRKTINRPAVSLNGAAMTGPKARPRQNSDTPSRDTLEETWYCAMTCR